MSGERILIVEDKREIVDLVRDYLTDEGFEVLIAYDGEQGLKSYNQFKPDLVILDIMLPRDEGTEIARVIRSQSTIMEDNGPGIHEDDLGHIFREEHGGRIWAESAIGKGTRITTELPIIESDIFNAVMPGDGS